MRPILPLSLTCLALALLAASPARGDDELRVWDRRGVWEAQMVLADGAIVVDVPDLYLEHVGVTDAVVGSYSTTLGDAVLSAVASGRHGLKLKGTILDDDRGEGTFKITMGETLDVFLGKVTFGSGREKVKGVFLGIYKLYSRYADTGPADVADLGIALEFAKAKSGKPLDPGKTAVLTAFITNQGPQVLPDGIYRLELTFGPVPVEIVRVVEVVGLKPLDYGDLFDVEPPMVSPVLIPIVVKNVTVLGIKFRVPEAAAGQLLTVDARLWPSIVPDGPPDPNLSKMAHAEIQVRDPNAVKLKFTLRNLDEQNPVHIFLLGDPDPYSEETRVSPGGRRSLTIETLPGTFLTFVAGRGGVEIDRCTGQVLGEGRATVSYDPSLPSFLSLVCGG